MARVLRLVFLGVLLIGVVIWVVLDLRAGAALRRQLARVQAAGGSLNLDDFIPPAVSEQENAAPVYRRAFWLMNRDVSDTEKCLIFGLMDDEPWDETRRRGLANVYPKTVDASSLTEAAAWEAGEARLARNEQALDLIRRAAAMGCCRFDVDYHTEDPLARLMPYAESVREAARLLVVSARVEVRNSRPGAAYRDILTALRLERTARQRDTYAYAVGKGVLDLALVSGLQKVLDRDSDHPYEWRILQRELAEVARQPRFLPVVQAERARYFALYNSQSLYGLLRRRRALVFVLRPWAKSGKAEFLCHMSNLVDAARLPTWEGFQRIPALEAERDNLPVWASFHILAAVPPKALRWEAETQAHLALARVALALKLHKHSAGAYPETLSALAPGVLKEVPPDPFTGKPLIYRRVGQGFIVYSVGPDSVDSEGSETPLEKGKRDEGVDIVWKAEM